MNDQPSSVSSTLLHPDLHIYHFAPYDPLLNVLMGRYAKLENEVDNLVNDLRLSDLQGGALRLTGLCEGSCFSKFSFAYFFAPQLMLNPFPALT